MHKLTAAAPDAIEFEDPATATTTTGCVTPGSYRKQCACVRACGVCVPAKYSNIHQKLAMGNK